MLLGRRKDYGIIYCVIFFDVRFLNIGFLNMVIRIIIFFFKDSERIYLIEEIGGF